jgi:MFS family permease
MAETRKITFFIALTLFAQEATWNFYDNQVPVLLRDHVAGAALVGVLMGMDNLLGIVIQPWIGNRSDHTRTRWGRRIPYLVVGMPVAALLFLLLPWATSLTALIVVMVGYALVMNTMRPLAEALTPDFVPPERRGRTNAIVKIATSLTIIVASLISLFVVDDHPRAAFAIPAAILLAVTLVLIAKVRDNRSPAYRAAVAEDRPGGTRSPVWRVVVELATSRDRRRVLLLLTIFLFGGAWFASRSLMTPYGMEALSLTRGEAGGLTLPSGVAFLIAAYPAALAAERLGRLRVIAAGMTLFAGALVAGAAVQSATGTIVVLCAGAAGAAAWNLAPSSRMLGAYTGLYAVTWYLGGFAGPALIGGAVDLFGWRWMLLDIAVLAALAVVVVIRLARLQKTHEPLVVPH